MPEQSVQSEYFDLMSVLSKRVGDISTCFCTAVMEMNVLADTSDESVMSLAQQQLFFKEASDASYRARSNLAPDQQVQQALSVKRIPGIVLELYPWV